ncbi:transcriptional regulator, ROK family protein [Actinosynnema sp. ALI-1.44]|uniref:ROK family transcriptional regulator n=1 Tax=Actinosynnema sp. ALI-1.44 TaxID=1933779 RepID=UPI00097BEEB3|nr:ROK family transcriptional regulator [Actinosynnema sp. ALI-1.44]ONI81416.1 transcriptional regulator, ROK family protein [Actinosynnema sp. ALI-1.44]
MTASNSSRLSGTQPRQARQTNTATVLYLLAQSGPLARGDIAEALSLNHGSVSRIVEPLLAAGLVRELTGQYSRIGRPRVPVELDPSSRYAVGVHLGVARTTVGLTDLAGHCLTAYAEERDPSDVTTTLRRAGEMAAETASFATSPVLGIGVAAGGEVDHVTGRIVRNDALGWAGVDVADRLREQTGFDVVVDSNVRAQLGAELAFGSGLRAQSVLYLFIGNVAEMGFVSRPAVTDPHGIVQGSIGRLVVPDLTGGHAPFGECGTDLALLAAARSAGLAATSLTGLIRLADHHEDPTAIELLQARSTQVARVVDTLHDLMRPDMIIIGGSGAPSDRWLDVVRDRVEATPPHALVRPRPAGNALITAAAGIVVRSFFSTGQLGAS